MVGSDKPINGVKVKVVLSNGKSFGLGTIFNLYAYMKTKNVIVSYIVHVIVDFYGYFAMLAFHVHM